MVGGSAGAFASALGELGEPPAQRPARRGIARKISAGAPAAGCKDAGRGTQAKQEERSYIVGGVWQRRYRDGKGGGESEHGAGSRLAQTVVRMLRAW